MVPNVVITSKSKLAFLGNKSFFIHFRLTYTSIFFAPLIVDIVDKKSYRQNRQKNCDEISIPHHSLILVKFNFDKFTFTYLNDHAIFKN